MRAVVVETQPKRRLVLRDVATPVRDAGSALVNVRAISLNRGEVHTALTSGAEGDRIGADFSGIVEEAPIGSGFATGDRVVGLFSRAAWAERIVVPPVRLVRLPEGVSFDRAAALPVAGLTAMLGLSKKDPIAGQRVLITGATGGVGMLAIQLAAHAGAHVTAFARAESHRDVLKKLGAEVVAIGSAEAAAAAPYDLILELVGGELLGQALGWLSSRGICVLAGNSGGWTTTFDAHKFRMGDGGGYGGTTLYGFFLGEELQQTSAADALAALVQKVADGSLDPMIGVTKSWSDIQQVASDLLGRAFHGKAVLTVD